MLCKTVKAPQQNVKCFAGLQSINNLLRGILQKLKVLYNALHHAMQVCKVFKNCGVVPCRFEKHFTSGCRTLCNFARFITKLLCVPS